MSEKDPIIERIVNLEKILLDPKDGMSVRLAVIEERIKSIEKTLGRHNRFFLSIILMLIGVLLKLFFG